MSGDLHGRAKEVFLAVRELEPDRRARRIGDLCGEDPLLRREVESLFEHFDAAGDLGEAEPAPPELADYELSRRIGEGGMGEVWEGEQLRPLRRRVAVKVLKTGLDVAELVRRFEAERQSLARMEHPAIATVLDAGASRDGRPFFAMEFVDGAPITDLRSQ